MKNLSARLRQEMYASGLLVSIKGREYIALDVLPAMLGEQDEAEPEAPRRNVAEELKAAAARLEPEYAERAKHERKAGLEG